MAEWSDIILIGVIGIGGVLIYTKVLAPLLGLDGGGAGGLFGGGGGGGTGGTLGSILGGGGNVQPSDGSLLGSLAAATGIESPLNPITGVPNLVSDIVSIFKGGTTSIMAKAIPTTTYAIPKSGTYMGYAGTFTGGGFIPKIGVVGAGGQLPMMSFIVRK